MKTASTTHTSAPWTIHWGAAQGGDGHWIMDPSDMGELSRIAMVAFHDDKNGDETRANARLIAAAPDLLAGIDQVCAALETLMAQHGDSMSGADKASRYAAIGAARRAQANAEGYATWEEAVNAWCDSE